MVAQAKWLEKIAKNRELRGEDFRVMFVMIANVDYFSVDLTQKEIAQKLSVIWQVVSRAVKSLQKLGKMQEKVYF